MKTLGLSISPVFAGVLLTVLTALSLALPVASAAGAAGAEPIPGAVWVFTIDDAIGPATSDYIERGIADANAADASLIIIEIDTPGGLDSSMRTIISSILASRVPVASHVTPRGARAASAGTYILYASHIAAMNEATNLGAATPVQIAAPSLPSPEDPGEEKESPPSGMSAMEKKIINDSAAYIRGLAELRDRNGDWAEEAVRDGVSLSASEAVELNVVDIIATDTEDLVMQSEGLEVDIDGELVTVTAAGKPFHRVGPDWREALLATLTNPNMILILGMLGFYGILLEFYNPGSLVPGVVGVICLILAGYAIQLLPVNYAGLALIIVGLSMMVAEAMIPSFGVLGIGGIIAFSIGGVMLFDTDMEAFQISLPAIAATGVVTGLLVVATIQIALRMRRKQVTTGVQTIVGNVGEALGDISASEDDGGQVRVLGEIWRANSSVPIASGSRVTVTDVSGMVLTVAPIEASASN